MKGLKRLLLIELPCYSLQLMYWSHRRQAAGRLWAAFGTIQRRSDQIYCIAECRSPDGAYPITVSCRGLVSEAQMRQHAVMMSTVAIWVHLAETQSLYRVHCHSLDHTFPPLFFPPPLHPSSSAVHRCLYSCTNPSRTERWNKQQGADAKTQHNSFTKQRIVERTALTEHWSKGHRYTAGRGIGLQDGYGGGEGKRSASWDVAVVDKSVTNLSLLYL